MLSVIHGTVFGGGDDDDDGSTETVVFRSRIFVHQSHSSVIIIPTSARKSPTLRVSHLISLHVYGIASPKMKRFPPQIDGLKPHRSPSNLATLRVMQRACNNSFIHYVLSSVETDSTWIAAC